MADDDWEDDGDDGEEPTIPCPHCRREIHEESQCCPYCGNYISEEDAPPQRKPWWIIVGAVLVLWVVFQWILGQ